MLPVLCFSISVRKIDALLMSGLLEQLSVGREDGVVDDSGRVAKTGKLVEVNLAACESLAQIIQHQHIPVDREETSLPGFSREETGNFYLCLVAICHQTTPRNRPPLEGLVRGEYKKGWDYLSARFEEVCRNSPAWFSPLRWSEITGQELASCFSDPRYGDRLTEPDERAVLVRDLGSVMLNNQWEWAESMYVHACGHVATGDPNLVEQLANFKAYRDPVRKKSYFFLSLMRNSGLWQYVDAQHLGPPVDYHETRGHLRLGTVVVNDPSLRQKLIESLPVTEAEDIALRSAIHDAIMVISELTGLKNPSQLHYLFWNVFRSCCSKESPHCNACPSDCPLPDRYVHLAIPSNGPRRCPFTTMCADKCATAHERYYEQLFETDYY